jgi:hypothetical protein
MSTRNGNGSGSSRRSRKKGRALLREALEHTVSDVAPSHSAAARWLKKDASTVRRWLAGTHRMDVEAVLDSERLADPFARCLRIVVRRNRKAA